jgi:hypothetical protein
MLEPRGTHWSVPGSQPLSCRLMVVTSSHDASVDTEPDLAAARWLAGGSSTHQCFRRASAKHVRNMIQTTPPTPEQPQDGA